PKRRHSNSRTRKRRTHWKISLPQISTCPECGTPKPLHRACPKCGYYRRKKVVEVTEDES
ncbi:MAG TPA: 50S ribosomal protein L32, partial [Candidatus Omnitrophica bacterium]|nr:50S ribosomal protein L32 [Candidatus Omnitrophota bacterium]